VGVLQPTSFKDAQLNELAETANVAQFVSFGPDLQLRFWRVREHGPKGLFGSVKFACERLLNASVSACINVRSYRPDRPEGNEFHYGLPNADAAASVVERLASQGCYTIVNETIDINDGGVSGVMSGGVVEFAPGDTPRCVEKPGTALVSRLEGIRMLQAVYGFEPDLDFAPDLRVEFSLHPLRRGFKASHTIVWEVQDAPPEKLDKHVRWPNKFSRLIGDKAFGLLVAYIFGAPVPRTTVVGRRIAPFTFGVPTGTGEVWLRTCPVEQVPGRYTTVHGWHDPFELLQREDPNHRIIASILRQDAVEPRYSGAAMCSVDDALIVEGVVGTGDRFMIGETGPTALPAVVREAVRQLFEEVSAKLGKVRFEWVFDGNRAWIVQLHAGAVPSSFRQIYPGEPAAYNDFQVHEGLERLRNLIAECQVSGHGIVVVGDIGITSHVGDLLRRAKIPSFVRPAEALLVEQLPLDSSV